jgi:multidrug efflux pump subunit AcrB
VAPSRRPFTVIVAVIGIALCSILALLRMPIDIFPNLNLPVVCGAAVWRHVPGTDGRLSCLLLRIL